MFDGHYREKEASIIPVPNIRFEVFEKMMRAIYTSKPVLHLAAAETTTSIFCINPVLQL